MDELKPKKYRKTALIEAVQWFAPGDHPAVQTEVSPVDNTPRFWIDTLEGIHAVTPGDWIATGVQGEHWPIKPDIFAASYEPAEATRHPEPAAPDERVEKVRLLYKFGGTNDFSKGWNAAIAKACDTLAALKAEPAHDDGLVERLGKLEHRFLNEAHQEYVGETLRKARIRIEALEAALVEARGKAIEECAKVAESKFVLVHNRLAGQLIADAIRSLSEGE